MTDDIYDGRDRLHVDLARFDEDQLRSAAAAFLAGHPGQPTSLCVTESRLVAP